MAILIRALTWNIFHGLDKPPNSRLVTWRSRLFRVTEMDALVAYLQILGRLTDAAHRQAAAAHE